VQDDVLLLAGEGDERTPSMTRLPLGRTSVTITAAVVATVWELATVPPPV
jgi:hypothetical protein